MRALTATVCASLVSILANACVSDDPAARSSTTGELLPLPSRLDCHTIDRWIEANAGRLPTRYAELVRYPEAIQRRVFATLSPLDKSSFWRAHLSEYATTHPDLTVEQRSYVGQLEVFASPDAYVRGPDALDIAPVETLAILLFGDEAAAMISIRSTGPAIVGEVPAAIGMVEAECGCSTKNNLCAPTSTTAVSCSIQNKCTPSNWGCGFLGLYSCNGLCAS